VLASVTLAATVLGVDAGRAGTRLALRLAARRLATSTA
jgi:hypothetical protein